MNPGKSKFRFASKTYSLFMISGRMNEYMLYIYINFKEDAALELFAKILKL